MIGLKTLPCLTPFLTGSETAPLHLADTAEFAYLKFSFHNAHIYAPVQ